MVRDRARPRQRGRAPGTVSHDTTLVYRSQAMKARRSSTALGPAQRVTVAPDPVASLHSEVVRASCRSHSMQSIVVQPSGRLPRATTLTCTGKDSRIRISIASTRAVPVITLSSWASGGVVLVGSPCGGASVALAHPTKTRGRPTRVRMTIRCSFATSCSFPHARLV
jgi:hypothetical protein